MEIMTYIIAAAGWALVATVVAALFVPFTRALATGGVSALTGTIIAALSGALLAGVGIGALIFVAAVAFLKYDERSMADLVAHRESLAAWLSANFNRISDGDVITAPALNRAIDSGVIASDMDLMFARMALRNMDRIGHVIDEHVSIVPAGTMGAVVITIYGISRADIAALPSRVFQEYSATYKR